MTEDKLTASMAIHRYQATSPLIDNVPAKEFIIEVNKTLKLAGDSLWAKKDKGKQHITITDAYIHIQEDDDGLFIEDLQLLFVPSEWDIQKDGLVYTDSGFETEFKNWMIKHGFPKAIVNDIGYSEQGMQTENYISFDADKLGRWLWENTI